MKESTRRAYIIFCTKKVNNAALPKRLHLTKFCCFVQDNSFHHEIHSKSLDFTCQINVVNDNWIRLCVTEVKIFENFVGKMSFSNFIINRLICLRQDRLHLFFFEKSEFNLVGFEWLIQSWQYSKGWVAGRKIPSKFKNVWKGAFDSHSFKSDNLFAGFYLKNHSKFVIKYLGEEGWAKSQGGGMKGSWEGYVITTAYVFDFESCVSLEMNGFEDFSSHYIWLTWKNVLNFQWNSSKCLNTRLKYGIYKQSLIYRCRLSFK